MPDELRPRHLAVRVGEIVAVIGIVAIAISALPGLGEVRARLGDANGAWVAAIAAAELGSCAGYLLAFRATFCPEMPWDLAYDIAMAEQAANSLLPAGGAGGLALGVWALRQAGLSTAHIGRRTVAFFVVTSAPNFFGVIVVGLAAFTGVLAGGGSAALTLLPALITTVGVVLVTISPKLLRALGQRAPDPGARDWRGRARAALYGGLSATADGVEQAIALLRSRAVGVIVGSFAYLAFDLAALGFGFAAVGAVPAFSALVLGYLIGQLGNLLPVPGGVGGTEGALVGMFALYGVSVPEATAAVLAYRLFQLTVPAVVGVPAFVTLRRKLTRADRPALMCGPLAADGGLAVMVDIEVVRLPPRD
jgi:uncharacterized protein (TIRG00374 family)